MEQLSLVRRKAHRQRGGGTLPAPANLHPRCRTIPHVESHEALCHQEPVVLDLKSVDGPGAADLSQRPSRLLGLIPPQPCSHPERGTHSSHPIRIATVARIGKAKENAPCHLSPVAEKKARPDANRPRRPELAHNARAVSKCFLGAVEVLHGHPPRATEIGTQPSDGGQSPLHHRVRQPVAVSEHLVEKVAGSSRERSLDTGMAREQG